MTFPVQVIPDDAGDLIEQLGTKLKFWYFDPVRGACLYKQGRRGTGEDWAERVACEVAEALGLPHATYDLAIWRGQQGVVTPSFRPADSRLVFGNELLVRTSVADHELDRGYLRQHHTIPRVFRLLSAVNLRIPQPWPANPGGLSAGKVFVGYLLLDALIGNQDRHDENWGIVATNSELLLQPTFDHASSLGRNETDDRRLERLNSKDELRSVAHYCKKAKSWLFAGVGQESRLTTLQAFLASAQLHTAAAIYWLGKLDSLPEEFFRNTLDRVPDDWISATAKEFAMAMMLSNRARLLGIKL